MNVEVWEILKCEILVTDLLVLAVESYKQDFPDFKWRWKKGAHDHGDKQKGNQRPHKQQT